MTLSFPDDLLAVPHRRDVPFSKLTTLGVGGICHWLFEPTTEAEAAAFLRACAREQIPYRVLGGGSNLVVLGDVHRPVVRLKFETRLVQEGTRLAVPANFGHIRLSEAAAEAGLAGYEHACGIPGTCGGALAMNAGANGRELVDVLHRYRYLTPDGTVVEKAPDPGEFLYRRSHLRHHALALGFTIQLAPGDREALKAAMASYREKRARTQPLDTRNAGCLFKNPPGDHAGRLIEAAGLKGLRVGTAEVSPRHANFLVNLGQAHPADFAALIQQVQHAVAEKHGICLELEAEVWPAENNR